jgi:formate dehydrogenase major subunit
VPGLGATLGRGGATMPQWDLVNADCIVVQGSDMAECHPVAFRFVVEAKERGARIIHVDPRFSRTSALADLHVPIRPGGDVALLGGLIRHVIESGRWFREYVVAYTNAADLVDESFRDTEELDGLFSGYDPAARAYDQASWRTTGERDETLEHPRCVFQVLRRHFARYTPEMVEQVAGVPPALFEQVAGALLDNSGRDRTGAICYAVGWTQHTTGVQTIRAAAILQLLLGNMGRPGGGILALRGHATIQGSTDIPTLYHLLPGYLRMPTPADDSLTTYLASQTPWQRAYVVSLLKAWYGDAATPENEFGFGLLPRITSDHSHIPMFLRMRDGGVRGLFVMGQNPAVGGQNARLQRRALGELDWLVVRDLFETETAAFWRRSPEVERGEVRPRDIKTEVFFLPAAASLEKDGSYTNTHRLIQWHDKAVDPPGQARSEAQFMVELGRRLKALYAGSALARDRAVQAVAWEYPDDPAEAVLAEISGYRVADRAPVAGFDELRDDGSTACGAWIYSGVFAGGQNRARARVPDERGWGFAWPANRRTLYNRASADPAGRPWSDRKRLIEWDGARWAGQDVPDVASDVPGPFYAHPGGRAQLFVPAGLLDGPLPTHYEPIESPIGNALYGQATSPTAPTFPRRDNRLNDDRYPYAITTYRLTEHHTAGAMTRWLPWLAELQPELFCEIGPELAAEKGVRNGDWVVISTRRGEAEARALVTDRIKPLRMRGRVVHQVGLPWHWGYQGLVRGDVANDLTALVADPNVTIHEAKAFTCDLRPGRRARRD